AFVKTTPQYEAELERHQRRLDELQQRHYAANEHALLAVFQGMDASGKHGAIRHVMSGIDPRGWNVVGFKQPPREELEHDCLWRTCRCLPERGRLAIFNRSYYEEVLIVRVHPQILEGEGVPGVVEPSASVWESRYRSIVEHEKHLHRNGTAIV